MHEDTFGLKWSRPLIWLIQGITYGLIFQRKYDAGMFQEIYKGTLVLLSPLQRVNASLVIFASFRIG